MLKSIKIIDKTSLSPLFMAKSNQTMMPFTFHYMWLKGFKCIALGKNILLYLIIISTPTTPHISPIELTIGDETVTHGFLVIAEM